MTCVCVSLCATVQVCLVFPQQPGRALENHSDEQRKEMQRFCGKRTPTMYDEELQNRKVVHFGSGNVSACVCWGGGTAVALCRVGESVVCGAQQLVGMRFLCCCLLLALDGWC